MPRPARMRLIQRFIQGLRCLPATLKIGTPDRNTAEPARSQLPQCGSARIAPEPPAFSSVRRMCATATRRSSMRRSASLRENIRMRNMSTALKTMLRNEIHAASAISCRVASLPIRKRSRRFASFRRDAITQ